MSEKNNPPNITRKQLVGIERERAFSRILIIAAGVIVAIVLGLVSWGAIQENVLNPRVIVAVVEGEEINGRQFQSRVRANRQQMINTYIQLVQNYQIFGAEAGFGQQILGQINQIQFQLQPVSVGASTVNQLVDDRLIILEAEKMGISVSDEEVEADLNEFFGYFPNGEPSATPSATIAATSTLSETQLAIVTLTPTSTPAASATPLENSEDEEEEAVPTATATPFTLEAYEEVYASYLDSQSRDIGLTEEDLLTIVRTNLYRLALFEIVTADVASDEEQVWARHILVEDEETANEVLGLLSEGGEWVDLAAEYSLDPGNAESGGDLGWFAFESMVLPFAEAAFDMEIGEISEPVESTFGFHIIQVLGHEFRPMAATAYAQARNAVFQDFVQGLRNDYEWEIFDTWFEITPDDPEIPFEYRLSQ